MSANVEFDFVLELFEAAAVSSTVCAIIPLAQSAPWKFQGEANARSNAANFRRLMSPSEIFFAVQMHASGGI